MNETTIYEAVADAVERAMADPSDALPALRDTANRAAIDQALADLQQAATDAAAAGIDEFVDALDRYREAIEDLATEAFDSVDALLVRTLQSNLPRTFALLVLIGVIDEALVAGQTEHTIDWERLQQFITDPGTLVNEAFWSALIADLGGDPRIGRMIAILIALVILAPQTIISLARGNLSVASIPPLDPGANADPLWSDFLTATDEWLSLTLPLPDPTKTAPSEAVPNPPDRMIPAGLFELAGGIDPNIALTLAFRAARGINGGDGQVGTDFETWLGVSLEDNEFVVDLGNQWKLQVEPGFVFGFGYAGQGDRDWHASVRQFLPGGGPNPAPDDEVTLRVFRDMPEGTPDLLLGPPYDTRLEIGDIEAFLHVQEARPAVEIGVELLDAAAVLANRWFRFFGQTDSLFREGVRLDIEQLRLSYAFGEGVRFNLTSELSTILVFDWQIGGNDLNVTWHSLRINVPLNFDLANRRYEASAELRLHLSGTLGPLLLVLDGIGVWAGYRQLGDDKEYVGFLPPTGAGASITLPAVSGGAYLDWTGGPTDRMGGVFHLRIFGMFSVTAFGIYERLLAESGETEDDRPISLIMVIGITFRPGIQLGFGIAISGFGGIVGINRTIDTNALLERLTSGAALNVLFPDDPIKNAPTILRDLQAIFPGERGSFVVGPTIELNWIEFFFVDLGLILKFPGPSKIVLMGVARAELMLAPKRPYIQVRIDFVGIIDFEQEIATFDATLINSKALLVFHVTGDAAFRLSWGAEPYVLLSLGGFHPEFDPAPAVLPEMTRIALTYEGATPYWIRVEAYFAVTSNTVQFGGKVEAGFQGGGFHAIGWLALDVLVQFSPFYFSIKVSAGFRVRYKALTLAGVRFSGTLSGPGPMKLAGKVCIELLFFDICWKGEIEFGDTVTETIAAVGSVVQALAPELSEPANLEATRTSDPLVSIRQAQTSEGGPEAILSPLGGLRWTQKKAPLRTTLERFGGSPLTTTQRIELTVDRPTTATDDWFAPGSFVELTQSEALNRPSFERLTAGADIGFGGLTGDGNPITHEADVDVIKLPEPEPISLAFLVALPGIVVANASRRDAAAAAAHVAPIIGVSQETMSVVESSGATVHTGLSATEAHQRARHNGGVAVTDVDVVDLVGV